METRNIGEQSEQLVFKDLLKQYPANSIISNARFGNAVIYSDFLIVDQDNHVPLMTVEVKSHPNKQRAAENAYKSLKRQLDVTEFPLKAIAAIVEVGQNKIEYIDFTEAVNSNDYQLCVNNYHLPPYDVLISGTEKKALDYESKKQKEKIDVLKCICWIVLPIVCILFMVLDGTGVYELSVFRLIMIGALSASILLPCFQEIQIGKITIKRMIDKLDGTKKESEN